MPELVETSGFLHFRFITLNGPAARNKGMALFPREIEGRYAMLSRQDNESIFLMFSDTQRADAVAQNQPARVRSRSDIVPAGS